ncbi:MAG: type II toxin-antitoxin system RelE/ParE family toxin [Bacteroidetes bacterium]|nr:type II toxin-antitoxin system RelE/ParE family toxin [Bacteroidota bacterium]
MKYKLEIQAEAIRQLAQAYTWYEEQRTDLGKELLEEIADCYSSITYDPERYGFAQGSEHFRRIRVFRFPYIVVYELVNDIVIVVSILHTKQNRSFL